MIEMARDGEHELVLFRAEALRELRTVRRLNGSSEHLPLMAKMADKLAFIRSIVGDARPEDKLKVRIQPSGGRARSRCRPAEARGIVELCRRRRRSGTDPGMPLLASPMIERADYCVLVVDDHEPSRYATARALRAAGFRTIEAAAGAEALELAEYASAVVLDVPMA